MTFQAGITIVLLVFVIILYITEKIPLTLTAVISMLSVYFLGILDFSKAFSGFSNNAFIMIVGMSFFASAFSATGLIDLIMGKLESKFIGNKALSERRFILIGGVISAVLSMFLNPMLVVTIFMDTIDAMSVQSGSKITRRNTYLPIAIASVYGSMLTSVSATTIIVTSSLMEESAAGRGFSFFEPAVLGIPCLIVFFLVYSTFGYYYTARCCRFDDSIKTRVGEHKAVEDASPAKMAVSVITLLVCIGFILFSDYALGAIAFSGAAVLVLTKCVDMKTALKEVNWSTAVLLAASIGFAKGVEVSGAGKVIAEAIIGIAGPLVERPVGLCFLALVVSSLLSNFMSNSSTALILVPIFLITAETVGAPLVPVVIASGVGAGLATATPVCTAHITLTTSAGYRFKDYVCVGGLLNLISIVACTASLYLVYLR